MLLNTDRAECYNNIQTSDGLQQENGTPQRSRLGDEQLK